MLFLITGCGNSSEPNESDATFENKDAVASDMTNEEVNDNMVEYAEFEGVVANKYNEAILVVPNMNKEEVENFLDKTDGVPLGKLIEEAVFYKVETDDYERVELGDRVNIHYDSSKTQQESHPPIRISVKLEVVG
ncbi:DUF3221 domain-containing protein [Paenalkalicoccus suaedae]|uniref:DUF3221 domain-containing protein n=1 Tax=Paenalkalicoccus suaedae TaxID=2592382 RepID=A0A859FGP5_9BACI|nr:DUF3221 domain-containing protein [Paenalkalicoccus suaedae]